MYPNFLLFFKETEVQITLKKDLKLRFNQLLVAKINTIGNKTSPFKNKTFIKTFVFKRNSILIIT